MKTIKTVRQKSTLFLFMSLLSLPPFAQQANKQVFIDFVAPLAGQWQCTIQTRDDSLHLISWKDVQLRQFQWKLAKDVFEETALFPQKDTLIVHGLHLMSYDSNAKIFFQSGYWSNKPGRTFDIEGRFSNNGKAMNGTMRLYKENGQVKLNRVELKWTGSNRFEYRVFKKDKKGIEFVLEELIYNRKNEKQ